MCQLVCSVHQEGSFNPAQAKIKIGLTQRKNGKYFTPISFTDECVECGLCVSYCYYGALTRKKEDVKAPEEEKVEVSSEFLDYR
jgi:ferredoxin